MHQIVGLGAAAEFAGDLVKMDTVRDLRDRLETAFLIRSRTRDLNGTSDAEKRLPNTSNISFENTNGEMILARLNDLGVCVSTGSACNAVGPYCVTGACGNGHSLLLRNGLDPILAWTF